MGKTALILATAFALALPNVALADQKKKMERQKNTYRRGANKAAASDHCRLEEMARKPPPSA